MKRILPFLLLFASIQIYSQGFVKTHVAKVGLSSLLFRSVALNYEYVFSENKSLSFHGGFMIPMSVPGKNDLQNDQLSGFFIMPEFRFYPSMKIAPGGFYLAPYIRYNHYKSSFGVQDFYQNHNAEIEGTLTSYGAALQLGYQFFLSQKLTLDVYFLGIGLFQTHVKATITPDDPAVLAEFKQEVDDVTLDIPILGDKLETKVSNNDVTIDAPFLSPGVRIGFSLGFAIFNMD